MKKIAVAVEASEHEIAAPFRHDCFFADRFFPAQLLKSS